MTSPSSANASTPTASSSALSLDSTYFVAFEMAHDALRRGLAVESELNVTQYRALMKLANADGRPLSQSSLGDALGFKPNVVTQTADALEARGYATRAAGDDARTRYLRITPAGLVHVDAVNPAVVDALYRVFPTRDASFRHILEAAVAAGARIDPPARPCETVRYPASQALVSIERIRQETERTLKEACGASFNECRVVQRLGETKRPLRIGALANDLALSPVNVARAADRLAQRGWVRRLKSPDDRKAVFADLTDEGAYQSQLIRSTLNDLANTRLWVNLSDEQQEAIGKVGHVVVAGLRAQKEAREQAKHQRLQVIESPSRD